MWNESPQVARHLYPELLEAAKAQGIECRPIDVAKPLEAQGPFAAIVHKVRGNPGEDQCRMPAHSAKGPSLHLHSTGAAT